MTRKNEPANLVVAIDEREIRVRGLTREVQGAIQAAGFRLSGESIELADERDVLRAAELLAGAGACFSGGASGWPPSEVLAALKREGRLSFEFVEVLWRGPGDFFFVNR